MKLRSIIATVALAASAKAATITVTNVDFGLTNAVVSEAGTAYANSTGIIAIGVFSTLTDLDISSATSVATLAGDFKTFGTTAQFGAGFGLAGTYQFETTGATPGVDGFAGNIYTFIGNGATLAASTEILVYKNESTFVADPGASDPALLSDTLDSGTLLLGGFNNYSEDIGLGPAPAYNTVNLIPEPSVALLGALGVFGLLRRRR